VVVPLALSEGAVAVDVDVSGMEGDATLFVDEDVSVAALFAIDVGSCAGVEVEETNGGAFWMYELSDWTA